MTVPYYKADGAYAHAGNYMRLENAGIEAVIPPQRRPRRKQERIPARRFKYDSRHHRVRCPAGKTLRRSHRQPSRWVYRSRAADCRDCPLRRRCFSPSASSRTIVIADGHEALLRARRCKERGWQAAVREKYCRHRWRVEGIHGQAKSWHGLRRAHRRGLWNVAIQVYLTAAVINLKRLASAKTAPGSAGSALAAIRTVIGVLYRLLSGLRGACHAPRGPSISLLDQHRRYSATAA